MQIFTTNYSTKAIRTLTGLFRNVKNFMSLGKPGKHAGALHESRSYVSGKSIIALMALCMFMGFTSSVFAQAVDLVSSPTSVAAEQGDTFTVTIEIPQSNSQAFNAASLFLNFNPAILQVTSVVAASGNQFNLPVGPSSDNTLGTINYSGTVIGTSFTAGFPILDITFNVIGDMSTNVDFNFNAGGSRNTNIALNGGSVFGTAVSIPVTIANANETPVADFTINPTTASTNEIVTFDGSFSMDNDGTVDSYAWDFGDGTTQAASANSSTTHSYTVVGQYQVALTVTDDLGAMNTTTKMIMVNAPTVNQFTVNSSSNGNGIIAPAGAVSVSEGGDQLFTFTPDAGFEVSEVLVGGVPVLPVPTTSFTLLSVSAPETISVSFSEISTGPFQLCIASGSGDLTAFGRSFVGDPGNPPPTGLGFTRTGGLLYAGYNDAIADAATGDETTLYQKEIYGGKTVGNGQNPPFTYEIPVANGTYQVDLYFAEVFHPSSGGRIFDVFLENNLMLDEYDLVDPIKDGLSTNKTAIVRTYNVSVTDGILSLQMGPASVDNGKLSGICVTEAPGANLHPITAIGDLTYDALVAVADPLTIVDPENDELSIVFNGLPASLSYDPTTNQIQGTPLATDANTYTINAIISDGTNSPVTEEFTLVINPAAGNDAPTIDAIADVEVNEGEAISQAIMVTDDNLPAATIELFDVSEGGTNNPFTPTTAVAVGALVDNSGGSYTFNWTPAAGSGRSYLARVTANDGANSPVIEEFRIDVAQQLPGTILARTFNNPVPWYGSSAPDASNGYSVAIETTSAQNIGYIDNGDFVEYLINVPTAGVYDLEVFAGKGSPGTTAVTFLEENGGDFAAIGSVNVITTGWQTYVSYKTQVTFTNAGVQTLRFNFNGGANIRDFNFSQSASPVFTVELTDQNNLEEDTPIGLAVAANDPDGGDPVTFSDNGTLPPGLSIDSNTGAISGTIDVGAEGTYSVVITATDDEADITTSEFNWNIGTLVSLPLCINSGNQGAITAFGKPFIADQYVTPADGNFYNTPGGQAISGTTPGSGEEDLYQSEHWTNVAGGLQYNIPTGNGDFTIELYMAELFANASDARLLNITIEGVEVLTGLDLFGTYGKFTAATLPFSTTVTDGFLDIVITSTADNPKLNGLCVSVTPPNTPPIVAITGPTNINVSRGTNVSFTGEAIDVPDGDISTTINWSSDDNETVYSAGTTGAAINASFVRPGSTIVTASATDIGGLTGSDTFTVNVSAPEVTFAAPQGSEVLTSLTVAVTVNPLDVLFDNAEHFHVYINPPNVNALDPNTRISTAPVAPWKIDDTNFVFDENSGALAMNGLGEGIQEGANTIVIRVADQFHNEFTNTEAQAIVNFTVELPDTTDPIAVCQDITVELDATGSITITAADVDGGSTDDQGIASLAIDVESFTGANLGPNTVTLTVIDTNNNTATCTATVTVEDNLAPVAVCTDFTLQLDANGVGSLTASNVDGGSSDNVAVDAISIDTSDFDVNNVGANTVTLTVTDASGNSATCTATVTVEDNVAPIAICQNIEVVLDANGLATITAADIDNGSNDASGIASLSVGTSSFDCDDIGDNTVMMTVVDNNGNTATCMSTVTVIDDTPPVLVDCPGNRFITSPTAQILELTPPTAIDACGVNPVVGSRSDGLALTDAYLVGTTTTITWMATDNNGVVGTCQTQVTISAPISSGKEITGFDVTEQVGDEIINSGAGTIALTVSTGTSLNGLAPTIAISNAAQISPVSGAVRDFTTPQTYTVTAEDATTKEWTVTISVAPDTEAPVVSCPDTIIVANDPGECGAVVTFDDATTTDNVGVVSLSYSVPNGSVFDVGTTTVMVTATDAAGLTASCSFDVTVNDMEAPIVSCLGNQTEQGDINGDFAMPDYTGLASALDNCDGSTLLTQNPLPGTVISGTTLVTITSEDTEGNSGSCTFDVTVIPETLPSLTIVPSAITVNLIQGETAMRDYVVNSDNASTLPTPAAMSIIDNATNNPATWASTTSAANQGTSYEVNVDATGLAPGTYNATLTAGPVTGYTNASIPVTLIVAPAVGNGALIVLDATTDTPLFDLTDGLQISKATIGNTPLGIIFNTNFNPGGVVFSLSGPITENRTEGPAPHSLFGDIGVNIQGKPFPVGNYTLVANPNVGPTITVNFTVTDVNPLCVNFDASLSGITNPSSCSGVGSATAVPSGGVAPFTYQWDNSETTATANNLTVGPHSVVVMDANGCSKTLTLNITGPSLPVVTLAPFANVLNTAPAFALTGGSPAGGTYTGAGVTNNMFNPASVGVGTYAVLYSYTDVNGCANSATRNITVTTETSNAALIVLDATTDTPLFALTNGLQISKATIGNTPLGIIFNSSLNPGGVVFSLSGPITENRTEGPAPHSLFGDIGVNIQGKPFPIGNYTLVANPNVGPTITVNFSVTDVNPICVNFDASLSGITNPATCSGVGSATAVPSGGLAPFTYQWDNSETTATASNLTVGPHSVVVRDANGCSKTLTLTITGPSLPVVTLAPFATVLNTAPAFALTGGSPAGGTYTGAGVTNNMFNPASVGVGTYAVLYSYTDANGCTNSATRNITVTTETSNSALIVLDATDDSELFALTDGLQIDKSAIGNTPLGIIFNANLNPGGVQFRLTGPITEIRTEGASAPYSLFGDIGVNIQGKSFPVGNYTLVANPNAGPTITVNFSVVNGPLGNQPSLAARTQLNEMSIAPNPANVAVTLSFDEPILVEEILIFDVTGRLIKTIREPLGLDSKAIDFNVTDLPTGTYFIKTMDSKGTQYQEQMIIERY